MQADDSLVSEVFFALCKTVDTPVSLGAWLRYKFSHTELSTMDIRPGDYRDPSSFFADYAVVSYLSKYKGLKTGVNLEEEALRKFTTSEAQCRETNERLRVHRACGFKPRLSSVLHGAQRKIARLLGPFSILKVADLYGWGPGATLEIPRKRAFIDTKLCELPITVSRSCSALLSNAIESDLHWSEVILGVMPSGPYRLLHREVFQFEDQCRITTVPKNAKTDRVIAVEPRGNSFIQKGFGNFLRRRLLSVGIDLNNQSVNQHWASRAWDLGLATLDLRAASDTVSRELVWSLLPYEWASAMDACRSRQAKMPNDSVISLEKFSSMGNGFTFELETLIFWAISSEIDYLSGGDGYVAVYGDDIIVRSSISSEVCLTLQCLGFTVNDEKSFFDGPFYESCGKHYFMGKEVVPAYQKEIPSAPLEKVRMGNRLIRLAKRLSFSETLSSKVRPAWEAVRRLSRESHKWFLPCDADGDDGWLLTSDLWFKLYFDRRPPLRNLRRKENACRVDLNFGIGCRVAKTEQLELPAHELALLSWTLRRVPPTLGDAESSYISHLPDDGPLPFNGVVMKEVTSRVTDGLRWVVPTSGWFAMIWD